MYFSGKELILKALACKQVNVFVKWNITESAV